MAEKTAEQQLIADLQSENAKLKKDLDAANTQAEVKIKSAQDSAANLQKDLDAAKKSAAEKTKEIAELTQINMLLESKFTQLTDDVTSVAKKDNQFADGDDLYEFVTATFHFKGKVIAATDAIKDTKVTSFLIKNGSNVIRKVQ